MHTPKMKQCEIRFIQEIGHIINKLSPPPSPPKKNHLRNKTGMGFALILKYLMYDFTMDNTAILINDFLNLYMSHTNPTSP